jgi:hypothetical protein
LRNATAKAETLRETLQSKSNRGLITREEVDDLRILQTVQEIMQYLRPLVSQVPALDQRLALITLKAGHIDTLTPPSLSQLHYAFSRRIREADADPNNPLSQTKELYELLIELTHRGIQQHEIVKDLIGQLDDLSADLRARIDAS